MPCARSEEDIAQEAVFLDNIRGRQPRDGADVSKDICPERLCGACSKRPSRAEDALDERRVPLIDDAVRCERIRLDCVRACTQVLRMDLLNDKRCFDVRKFHTLAARMRPLRVIRTHATVKDERLFSYVFPYIDALLRHMYEPPCYLSLSQNAACDLDNAACITRIIICADLLRVVFRKYGAADHGLAGMPRLVEGVNRALHRRDRRRHQRR